MTFWIKGTVGNLMANVANAQIVYKWLLLDSFCNDCFSSAATVDFPNLVLKNSYLI